MALSSDILGWIGQAASKFGVSQNYLTRTAAIETGGTFDTGLTNAGSGAQGLFQFVPSTAQQYGVNPMNAQSSIFGAANLASDNSSVLSKLLGRSPTDSELYLAHQQGATGAAKLLSNPNALASDLVGLSAVINNGGSSNMTAGQFTSMWADKFNSGSALTGTAGDSTAQPVTGITGLFLRGTIIILGFIFVAVGLAMFRNPNTTVIEAAKGFVPKPAA